MRMIRIFQSLHADSSRLVGVFRVRSLSVEFVKNAFAKVVEFFISILLLYITSDISLTYT